MLLHPQIANEAYPVGAIIRANAPPNLNWLRCEGQILAKASYPFLVNALDTDNPQEWEKLTIYSAMSSGNGLTTCISNGSILVAIGYSGQICYSTDGINWTDTDFVNTTPDYYCICWSGSLFCVLGNGSTQAYTSSNGTSWTSRTMPVSTGWIGVAWDGTYFIAISSNSTTVYRSTDGDTWNSTGSLSATGADGIASDGAGLSVVANGSIINVSEDNGATWDVYRIGYGPTQGYVTYCNGYFMIPGTEAGGRTFISEDGKKWEMFNHNYGVTIDGYYYQFNPNLWRWRYMGGQYFGIAQYSHWGVRSPDLKSFYPWYLHFGDSIEFLDAAYINNRVCVIAGGGDEINVYQQAKFDTGTYFQLPRDFKAGVDRDNFGLSYYIRAK